MDVFHRLRLRTLSHDVMSSYEIHASAMPATKGILVGRTPSLLQSMVTTSHEHEVKVRLQVWEDEDEGVV